MNSDERGYVTVEHAIGFVAVTLVVGVIVAAAQAGMTGASLCQAVREGARAASIGAADPQGAASAAYPPGSYAVARSGGWVSVTGTAPYRGAAGWVGGIARCSVTTIDEGDLPPTASGCACRPSPTWRPWLGQNSRPRLTGRTWETDPAGRPPPSLQRMARVFSPARCAISTAWWCLRSQ